ncbi:rhythmically expressed gene 2 protein [Rhagoletis pomonella]|uniref:rhythmically expressed gene 2 protein n=1 Tax=Rhagoletis pomonella TaxID=28610 RepID=UPI00177FB903|nr:rhythmically expressed gene 2 protein [Rhagoletis pomonella]XP_036336377.1 rhythmically expressed gene 2 protein [Rhagoletis pomonella]XP_036336378.1 rhythmically expressed gene 2 protein [Rhagoletis pomonella]XP_036336379.1 rhythmically expressed gene 2 protein [Rhagoletis pomonella]
MTSALGRLRLITFDVTNTLLQFRTSPGKQYGEIGALFGVLCDNDELARNFKTNWYLMNRKYPNFGRNSSIGWQQWWHQLIGATFADSGSLIPEEKLGNLANHLLELYKTSLCWQNCNGSIDLLNYLRLQQQLAPTNHSDNEVGNNQSNNKSPISLGVIANFDPRLDILLRNLKIQHYFDFAINSYDSNVEKPNPEIFHFAMRLSELKDLKPEECLHIGDGPTTDYLAAKNVGWNSALIHEKNASLLIGKYGDQVEEHFVFPSLYDFHKKFSNNSIKW